MLQTQSRGICQIEGVLLNTWSPDQQQQLRVHEKYECIRPLSMRPSTPCFDSPGDAHSSCEPLPRTMRTGCSDSEQHGQVSLARVLGRSQTQKNILSNSSYTSTKPDRTNTCCYKSGVILGGGGGEGPWKISGMVVMDSFTIWLLLI